MEKLFQDLNKIIEKYDNFIIIGHKDPDLDSLGSCLGLYEVIKYNNKNAYIFLDKYDKGDYNSNVNQALNKINIDLKRVDSESYKYIKGKTLLIIIDTHIKERLEYPELVNEFDTIILDHHIRNKNYIKNTVLTYIDSNLSSMSELITYFIEYNNLEIDYVISTILLAGIEIDTNGFNLKTTAKTYEAASTLMEMGADTILKQELLKETKEDYMKRANFIRNSFMVTDDIAMCIITKEIESIDIAEIAEELLTFDEVNASIVIGKLDNDKISVSARSLGEIDVESIMTKLGGGGHSSNAAAQIENKSIKEVKKDIIDILTERD